MSGGLPGGAPPAWPARPVRLVHTWLSWDVLACEYAATAVLGHGEEVVAFPGREAGRLLGDGLRHAVRIDLRAEDWLDRLDGAGASFDLALVRTQARLFAGHPLAVCCATGMLCLGARSAALARLLASDLAAALSFRPR